MLWSEHCTLPGLDQVSLASGSYASLFSPATLLLIIWTSHIILSYLFCHGNSLLKCCQMKLVLSLHLLRVKLRVRGVLSRSSGAAFACRLLVLLGLQKLCVQELCGSVPGSVPLEIHTHSISPVQE